MMDELNIRELYNKIIEERAAARGVILMENVKIPSKKSSPDMVHFDGESISYERGEAFSFIGQNKILFKTNETHPYIFNALTKISLNPKDSPRILKSYSVKPSEPLSDSDLEYFFDKQKSQSGGDTRRNTFSGRIWKNIQSKSAGKKVSVVAFWGREKSVNEEILKKIKKYFGNDDIFWVASDSKFFNHYGDSYVDTANGETKELKSRIYPELSHDDIVDILMRAHTGFRMSPFEQKVVWEFRGVDPQDLKIVTGGYPTRAEYEYRKKISENHEKEPIR